MNTAVTTVAKLRRMDEVSIPPYCRASGLERVDQDTCWPGQWRRRSFGLCESRAFNSTNFFAMRGRLGQVVRAECHRAHQVRRSLLREIRNARILVRRPPRRGYRHTIFPAFQTSTL